MLAVPAYLLLCLLLGGASAAGILANMILQLLALPIILWALVVSRGSSTPAPGRQLLFLVVLLLLAIGIQLVPLPASLWTSLPGRAPVAQGYQLLAMPLPWLPISLAPLNTLASGLWLLPAIAVVLGIVRLGAFRTGWLAWAIVLVTAASVMVGALQLVGGEGSPWYFYKITNYGSTTGFFSNANHMATLLVVSLPFLAALYLSARRKRRSAQHASGLLVIVVGAVAVTFVGILINGSLAGLGLAVPAAAASLAMIWSRKRPLPRWVWAALAALAVGAMALAYSAPFANNNLTSTELQGAPDSRYHLFTVSGKAAGDFMPVGSGIGTFRAIFEMYENPATVSRFYRNHVHNDYIEVALETGVVGIILILLFLFWWLHRVVCVWRSEEPDYFARAASIATALILAHSLVDYPLRTAAISAVFAACCALMAEPRARVQSSATAEAKSQVRHLSAD
jgi:O-antigen ligase